MADTKKAPTVKELQTQLTALEKRVTELETHHKPLVDSLELNSFEEKLQKWLCENTLLKVAGIVVLGIILSAIIF